MPRSIVVRDAVHGDLTFTEEEARVMDTPEIQRLRGIKQLGTAYLVYPTALHTRFDHSLGTCHLAGRIIDAINRNPDSDRRIGEEEARILRFAALVHDVTHVPFGHTFEDERKLFPRHDEGSRLRHFLLESGSAVAEALESLGVREAVYRLLAAKSSPAPGASRPLPGGGPPSSMTGDSPPATARLALFPEPSPAPAGPTPPAEGVPPLRDLIDGTICADLLDYIQRDLFFTGFRQMYDDRLFHSFVIRSDPARGDRLALHLAKRGVLRNDALSEVMNLLRLRYALTERVYYHHAKVSSGAMISKAVECADGLRESDLLPLTDFELWAGLERDHGSEITRRILSRLRTRRLYKRVYLLTREVVRARRMQRDLVRDYHLSAETRGRVERELAEECGLPDGSVLIYCPNDTMAFKEAAVTVSLPDDPAVALNDPRAAHPAVRELEALQDRYLHLWRFTVLLDPERIDAVPRVEAACERFFRERNELRSPSAPHG